MARLPAQNKKQREGRGPLIATAVGSTSILVVFPEYRMVISTMMNKGGTNADDLAAATDQIAQAFIDRVP